MIWPLPSIERRSIPPGVRFHQRIELGQSLLFEGLSCYYRVNMVRIRNGLQDEVRLGYPTVPCCGGGSTRLATR